MIAQVILSRQGAKRFDTGGCLCQQQVKLCKSSPAPRQGVSEVREGYVGLREGVSKGHLCRTHWPLSADLKHCLNNGNLAAFDSSMEHRAACCNVDSAVHALIHCLQHHVGPAGHQSLNTWQATSNCGQVQGSQSILCSAVHVPAKPSSPSSRRSQAAVYTDVRPAGLVYVLSQL